MKSTDLCNEINELKEKLIISINNELIESIIDVARRHKMSFMKLSISFLNYKLMDEYNMVDQYHGDDLYDILISDFLFKDDYSEDFGRYDQLTTIMSNYIDMVDSAAKQLNCTQYEIFKPSTTSFIDSLCNYNFTGGYSYPRWFNEIRYNYMH